MSWAAGQRLQHVLPDKYLASTNTEYDLAAFKQTLVDWTGWVLKQTSERLLLAKPISVSTAEKCSVSI